MHLLLILTFFTTSFSQHWQKSSYLNNLSSLPTICDFDVIPDPSTITPLQFRQQYLDKAKPVLIRKAALHWPAVKRWTHTHLKKPTMQDTNQNSDDNYIFTRLNTKTGKINTFDDPHELMANTNFIPFDDVHPMPFFKDWLNDDSFLEQYFMMGGGDQKGIQKEHSGLSFHGHQEAWNAVIVGTKRWLLVAPSAPDYMTNFGAVDYNTQEEMPVGWISRHEFLNYYHATTSIKPKPKQIMECWQHAGDVLFVPENYQHAIFNYGDTVALSEIHDDQNMLNRGENGEFHEHVEGDTYPSGNEL